MTRHRSTKSRTIADGLNLTTMIRWAARHRGSFTIGREDEGNWRVIILRTEWDEGEEGGRGPVVYDSQFDDLSLLVEAAARHIRRTPEWRRSDDAGRARKSRRKRKKAADDALGGEGDLIIHETEYDWDIWKSPLKEENGGAPPLNSKGHPVKPPAPKPSRHHGVLNDGVLLEPEEIREAARRVAEKYADADVGDTGE